SFPNGCLRQDQPLPSYVGCDRNHSLDREFTRCGDPPVLSGSVGAYPKQTLGIFQLLRFPVDHPTAVRISDEHRDIQAVIFLVQANYELPRGARRAKMAFYAVERPRTVKVRSRVPWHGREQGNDDQKRNRHSSTFPVLPQPTSTASNSCLRFILHFVDLNDPVQNPVLSLR